MKTELRVHLYSKGSENDAILSMVANNNSGAAKVNLQQIAHYIDARKAQYPTIFNGYCYTYSPEIDTLDISEDNFKTFTLQLKECEVHELEDVEENPVFNLNKPIL